MHLSMPNRRPRRLQYPRRREWRHECCASQVTAGVVRLTAHSTGASLVLHVPALRRRNTEVVRYIVKMYLVRWATWSDHASITFSLDVKKPRLERRWKTSRSWRNFSRSAFEADPKASQLCADASSLQDLVDEVECELHIFLKIRQKSACIRLDSTFGVKDRAKDWFKSYLTGESYALFTAEKPLLLFKCCALFRRTQS